MPHTHIHAHTCTWLVLDHTHTHTHTPHNMRNMHTHVNSARVVVPEQESKIQNPYMSILCSMVQHHYSPFSFWPLFFLSSSSSSFYFFFMALWIFLVHLACLVTTTSTTMTTTLPSPWPTVHLQVWLLFIFWSLAMYKQYIQPGMWILPINRSLAHAYIRIRVMWRDKRNWRGGLSVCTWLWDYQYICILWHHTHTHIHIHTHIRDMHIGHKVNL